MDNSVTQFLTENAFTILITLYIFGGVSDALESVEGNTRAAKIIRAIGKFTGKIVDVFEGALEAVKPKRAGKKGEKE